MPASRTPALRLLAAAAVAALAAPALAADGDWPNEVTKRPLTLKAGMTEVWLPVNVNLSDGFEGEPWNLNPSIRYGVSDNLMIGVRHFVGVCPAGEENGCGEFYNDVSVDALLAVGSGRGVSFGVGGAINWAPIQDDSAWSAEVKVVARAGGGAFAITAAPTLNFGLNDRDAPIGKWTGTPVNLGSYDVLVPEVAFGNREFLLVPVTLQLQLGEPLALFAGASLNGPLNAEQLDFADVYTIPVTVGAVFTLHPRVDLGGALAFPNLAGADLEEDGAAFQLQSGTDQRILSVFATFRL